MTDIVMKILILQDDFPPKSFGGAGIIAFNYAKGLKEKGHSVSIITAVQNRSEEGEFEYEGLKIHRIYSDYHPRWQAYLSLYNPMTVRKVSKIIKEEKLDIVHAHNIHYHLSYYCLKLAKQSSAKVFLTTHDVMLFHYGKLGEFVNKNDLSCPDKFDYKISPWQQIKKFKRRYNPFRNVIIKHYLRYVDKIIPVCVALANALNQNGIKNTQVLHNGLDAADFYENEKDVEAFKSEFNLQGKKVMLFGGRISQAKGGDVALGLLIEISKVMPEICLMIAGQENLYVQELLKKADKSGVRDKVKILGWLDRKEIVSAYYASNVILSPSLYLDAFPTVNLEAMATRRPIIATCFDGAREAVTDGEAGYIVNPHNLPSVVSRTLALLTNENLAKKFGQNGYERFLKDFQLSHQVDKLEKIYHLVS